MQSKVTETAADNDVHSHVRISYWKFSYLYQAMNGRNVGKEAERVIRNSIIISTLTYASKTWT